ncbi:signal peptidase II [Facklamia sp. DSM 111018]|uniref:Lipoprotein signal peptidase n=1 Tax=Facklamia lactis TaxID=2749967 RepID=A0ABS0LMQ6_9LACT|nr:signal peptidase II [Facklamia lactis]MBG9979870.1 signal peptidase II [Facklamia lactis]MBG9985450.1 signal peptidase II [Facklamia lactis]
MIFAFLTVFFILLADQSLKYWILTNFDLYEQKEALSGVFSWFYIQNKGAGWGILDGKIPFLVVISLLVSGYLLYLIIRNRHQKPLVQLAYGLLLGGALGNLIDRLRIGYVVDMFKLEFINFPIFNIADLALALGIILLLLIVLFDNDVEELL